jgi:hypothetical protein
VYAAVITARKEVKMKLSEKETFSSFWCGHNEGRRLDEEEEEEENSRVFT